VWLQQVQTGDKAGDVLKLLFKGGAEGFFSERSPEEVALGGTQHLQARKGRTNGLN
jgi:hypothetical protein